jgi:two-component system nitrate/nitrite response regulator NarL
MGRTILIVDDSATLRNSLRALFEDHLGATCQEACNGQEAIERAAGIRPDLIVLDLSMPVMNGLEAAPQLLRLLPSVPIVMFSSFDDRLVLGAASAVGISAVVNKSEAMQLLAVVRSKLAAA